MKIFNPMVLFRVIAYPINVIIIRQRAGGYLLTKDKGKMTHSYQKTAVKLAKANTEVTIKGKTLVTPNNYMFLFERDGIYFPVVIENEKNLSKLKVLASDKRMLLANEIEKAVFKFSKPGFLEKWYPIISIFVVLVAVAILFILILPKYNEIAGTLSGISGQLSHTAQLLQHATAQLPPS